MVSTMLVTRFALGSAALSLAMLAAACGPENQSERGADAPSPPSHSPVRSWFPTRADGALRIAHRSTGMTVDVVRVGASAARGEVVGRRVDYRDAAGRVEATLRSTPQGVEDYVVVPAAPRASEIEYRVALRGVAGLRSISNVLELLDSSGAPRLRMTAPWARDAAGRLYALGVRVEGCFASADPRPPWGRPVHGTGSDRCSVVVSWDPEGVQYPLLVDPLWTSTTSLAVARSQHTVTALTDHVLVAGGFGDTGDLDSTEVYDAATGTWAMSFPMTGSRVRHGAVRLPGTETIFLMGGERFPAMLRSTEVFDLTTGPTPGGLMVEARSRFAAVVLDDGRVLVAGGFRPMGQIAASEVYDPIGGMWSSVDDLSVPRSRAASARLPDGRVLIAGGSDTFGPPTPALSTAEIFDPSAESWTPTASMAAVRRQPGIAAMPNGQILVFGGETPGGTISSSEVFDPSSLAWTPMGDLAAARKSVATALLPSGVVLAAGGADTTGPISTAEAFDPALGTWSSAGTLSSFHGASGSALLPAHQRMLVAGGCTTGASPCDGGRTSAVDILQLEELGMPCSDALDCVSGFCADGVCCDGACAGECRSCDPTTGRCQDVIGGEDPDTCAGAFVCDGAGACGRTLGEPCVEADECASDFCVDGVCCESACAASCEACSVLAGGSTDGQCEPVAGCGSDAGSVDGAADAEASDAAALDAGDGGSPPASTGGSSADGGCGCRIRASAAKSLWLGLPMAWLLAWRRRAAKRRHQCLSYPGEQ